MATDYTVQHIETQKLTDPQIRRIAELWRQLDYAENAYDAPHGLKMRHTSNNGLRQYLQKDNEGVTAAVGKDGKILGFARNFPAREYGNVNYISALSVDKDHRGQGIGRALLQNIVRSNRRKKRLSMLRVSLNNPAGLHLYGSMGFKPVSQTMVLDNEKDAEVKTAAGGKAATLADVAKLIWLLRKKGPGFKARPAADVIRRIKNPIFHGSQFLPTFDAAGVRVNKHPIVGDVDTLHFSPHFGCSSARSGMFGRPEHMRRGYMDVVDGMKIPELASGRTTFKEADRPVSGLLREASDDARAAYNARLLKPAPARRMTLPETYETIIPSKHLRNSTFTHVSKNLGDDMHPLSEIDAMWLNRPLIEGTLLGGTGRLTALIKMREAHPEFARYIDPVLARYNIASRFDKPSRYRRRYRELERFVGSGDTASSFVRNLPRAERKELLKMQPNKYSDTWAQELRDSAHDDDIVADMAESRINAFRRKGGLETRIF